MAISERLKQLASHEGSQARLARKVGVRSQVISKIINTGSGLHSDTIAAIAKAYPKLNLEWFITGEGEMWKEENARSTGKSARSAEQDTLKDEVIALQKEQLRLLRQTIRDKAPELDRFLKSDD